MDNYKKLDIIANGLLAVSKINNIRNSMQKAGSLGSTESLSRQGRTFPLDQLATLNEILKVLAQHSPEQYKKPLSEFVSKSTMYTNVYTNLMTHINSTRNQEFDRNRIIKTLDVVKPIADDRGKLLIDKILKLYEVFFL